MQATVRGLLCAISTSNHAVGDILFRKTSPVADAIQHSCRPNAIICDAGIVATEQITLGTEITLDYVSTDWQVNHPPRRCLDCGAILCNRLTECKGGSMAI